MLSYTEVNEFPCIHWKTLLRLTSADEGSQEKGCLVRVHVEVLALAAHHHHSGIPPGLSISSLKHVRRTNRTAQSIIGLSRTANNNRSNSMFVGDFRTVLQERGFWFIKRPDVFGYSIILSAGERRVLIRTETVLLFYTHLIRFKTNGFWTLTSLKALCSILLMH